MEAIQVFPCCSAVHGVEKSRFSGGKPEMTFQTDSSFEILMLMAPDSAFYFPGENVTVSKRKSSASIDADP
jgi:hypothetical protein